MVYRLGLRMHRDEGEARESAQEAFLKMHRSLATFDSTRPLRPWVARVAYTTCLQRMRGATHKATDAVDPDDLAALPGAGPTPEQRSAQAQHVERLDQALGQLSAQDQALVLLRYRDELELAEVSEATGLPVTTIKTRLFRARQALRRLLSPAPTEELRP